MNVVKIALSMVDGSLAVMSFVTDGRGNELPEGGSWVDQSTGKWRRPATAALVEAEIARTFAPGSVKSHRPVESAELPEDRTFRDAWTDDGRAITHNMSKAKELRRGQIRHERAAAFPVLDGQWSRAFGQGKADEASAIEARRQALRDLPTDPRIDAAKTVEELKAITLPE